MRGIGPHCHAGGDEEDADTKKNAPIVAVRHSDKHGADTRRRHHEGASVRRATKWIDRSQSPWKIAQRLRDGAEEYQQCRDGTAPQKEPECSQGVDADRSQHFPKSQAEEKCPCTQDHTAGEERCLAPKGKGFARALNGFGHRQTSPPLSPAPRKALFRRKRCV